MVHYYRSQEKLLEASFSCDSQDIKMLAHSELSLTCYGIKYISLSQN
jgi:hypothetical protein